MKVLVTGANGQLGYDIVKRLDPCIECIGVDIAELDITDADAVKALVQKYCPTHVVHCAAYTAVDRAEGEYEVCRRVNVDGTKNIAAACKNVGATMVYFSTDYVYGGGGTAPFTVNSPTDPQNAYGRTKLEGENAAKAETDELTVIRTSWVFGKNGGNFVKTMLRLADTHDEIAVVSDQIGSPTYTRDLAELVASMLQSGKNITGIFHATNEGYCAWSDFAKRIMRQAGRACSIKPILTSEYPCAAVRPLNSRLDKSKLDEYGFARLPSWQDALERYLIEIGADSHK